MYYNRIIVNFDFKAFLITIERIMNLISAQNLMRGLSPKSLKTIQAHINKTDQRISEVSLEKFDDWSNIIQREFPDIVIKKDEDNLGKFLELLNRSLFRYLSRVDPLNLDYISNEDELKQMEQTQVYEKINNWLEEVYGKMTLAQLLTEPPKEILPEHKKVVEERFQSFIDSHEGNISFVHIPNTSLKFGAQDSDSLTKITDDQLDLIISFISSQEISIGLTLDNVGLRDNQLAKLCKLIEENKVNYLNLSNNKITDKGAMKIADSLSGKECELKELVLDGNNISAKGAENLISVIENSLMFILSLKKNQIVTDLFSDLTKNLQDPFSGASVQLE